MLELYGMGNGPVTPMRPRVYRFTVVRTGIQMGERRWVDSLKAIREYFNVSWPVSGEGIVPSLKDCKEFVEDIEHSLKNSPTGTFIVRIPYQPSYSEAHNAMLLILGNLGYPCYIGKWEAI